MSRILCGDCCRKRNFSLEDRKKMSSRIVWEHVHICFDCGIYLYCSSHGFIKTHYQEYVMGLVDLDLKRYERFDGFYLDVQERLF